MLSSLSLPADLFDAVSPRVAKLYRERAATEGVAELRRHPVAIRYTYLAAFCLQRKAEVIDSLIDLLLLVIRRIENTAEKRIGKQVVEEAKQRVDDKPRLLRRVAQAALDHPNKTIRKGIYPVMSREKCLAIVQEEPEVEYHDRVYLRMRSSYRDHYRRMMPGLLNMLEFRSNNESHRPVIEALALIKRYIGTPGLITRPKKTHQLRGWCAPCGTIWCMRRTNRGSGASIGSTTNSVSWRPCGMPCDAANSEWWEPTNTVIPRMIYPKTLKRNVRNITRRSPCRRTDSTRAGRAKALPPDEERRFSRVDSPHL